MKKRKNIEDLFRESFETLDMTPSTQVWENIQKELQEKKKRKVIPLWLRLGGAAALLALLFTVGSGIWNNQPAAGIEKQVVIEKSTPVVPQNNTVISEKTQEPLTSPETSGSKEKREFGNVATVSGKKNTSATSNKEEPALDPKKLPVVSAGETQAVNRDITSKPEEQVAISEPDENKASEVKMDNKPSIFDAIAQETSEKEEKHKNSNKRWNISPNVAPVFYSSLSNGSSIDPGLSENPTSGDVNMSYGVLVSYNINPKLSIRTGINNVDLSYSSNEIIAATGPASRGLRGVDYGGKQIVVTAISKNKSQDFDGLNLKSGSEDAKLTQTINYLEVPLELNYRILDHRFGINLIGGMSTLFLGANDISIRSQDFNSNLGQANNLSNVSFSTNIGVGLNYKLTRRFLFNVEPMFKYQINPYTDSSVDFKPYYLGIYSGLSFKF